MPFLRDVSAFAPLLSPVLPFSVFNYAGKIRSLPILVSDRSKEGREDRVTFTPSVHPSKAGRYCPITLTPSTAIAGVFTAPSTHIGFLPRAISLSFSSV